MVVKFHEAVIILEVTTGHFIQRGQGGKPVNRRQSQTQGSLIQVGSEGWPVLSNPIEELLELKLLKKLMLVPIERCQCIAVCCVWSCVAADRSGCPCCPNVMADRCTYVCTDERTCRRTTRNITEICYISATLCGCGLILI